MTDFENYEIKDNKLVSYKENGEEEIVIKEGITDIGFHAFTSLTAHTITLPNSVRKIYREAFYKCRNLKTVNIGKDFETFYKNAFKNCPKLEAINVDKHNPFFSSFDGILCLNNRIEYCPPRKKGELRIKEGIIGIDSYYLNRPFRNANKITSLVLPRSFKNLHEADLVGLTKLQKIYIPSTLSFIRDEVFYLCDKKGIEIIIDKDNPYYEIDDKGVYDIQNGRVILLNKNMEGKYTLKTYVRSLNNYTFEGCLFDTIVIPQDIVLSDTLTRYAGLFYNCNNLKRLIIKNKNTKITSSMFLNPNCPKYSFNNKDYDYFRSFAYAFYPSQLDSDDRLILSSKVCEIINKRNKVDEEWKNEWLTYFKKHTKLFLESIKNDHNLRDVFINEKLLSLKDTHSIIQSIEENNELNGDAEDISIYLTYENTSFSFEELMKEREERAKEENPFNTNYIRKHYSYTVLENGEIRIDSYKGCEKEVIVPSMIGDKMVTEIGPYAFSPKKKYIKKERKEKLKKIKKIVLPLSIKTIYECAFYYCEALEEINIPDNCTFNNTENNNHLGNRVFSNCESLQNITLGKEVTKLGYHIFYCCSSLEKITLPPKLEKLNRYEFEGCSNLEEVNLNEGLKEINLNCFEGCEGMEFITFPKSLTTLNFVLYKIIDIYASPSITFTFLNKDTNIILYNYPDITFYRHSIVIKSEKGGMVEQFALKNGVKFIEIE